MSRAEQRRRARKNGKHRASGKKGRRPDARERAEADPPRFDALHASGFVVPTEFSPPADIRGEDRGR